MPKRKKEEDSPVASDAEENSPQETEDEETDESEGEGDTELQPKTEISNLLTEQQLNIEIVRLRKIAVKAKGRTIQTLVRKARKLQKGAERNPANLKKAENLLESIAEIKHINSDAISKFAIGHNERECDVLISSSTEEKAKKGIARVAKDTLLRQKLREVSSQYPNWNDVVAKFCEASQKPKKQRKKSEADTTKPKTAKKEPKQPVQKKEKQPVQKKEKQPVQKKEKQPEPQQDSLKKLKVVKTSVKPDSEPVLRKLGKPVPLEIKITPKPFKKDSFFLSSDGQEVSSEEEEEPSEAGSEEEFKDESYKSRSYHVRNKDSTNQRRTFGALSNPGKEKPQRNIQKPFPPTHRLGQPSMKETRPQPKEQTTEKLHPSWEAKKRQQAILAAGPANKKITFD